MKFVVIDKPFVPEWALKKIGEFPEIDEVIRYDEPVANKQDVIKRVGDAELATSDIYINFNEELLKEFSALEAFFVQAVGYNQIDTATAKELGVAVYNCPGYNANAVAEFVYSLIVSLFRKVPQAQAHVRAGGWDYRLFAGQELRGKKLGIIGSGNVAQAVSKIAPGFSMELMAHTLNPTKDKAEKLGISKFVSLAKLLRESDVVVIAVPLNESTKGLISKKEIEKMKTSAILINTSRQTIVDEYALADALAGSKIAGAALDMLIQEPFDFNQADLKIQEMINRQNVIVTPHVAGVTAETIDVIGEMFVSNVRDYLDGNWGNRVV